MPLRVPSLPWQLAIVILTPFFLSADEGENPSGGPFHNPPETVIPWTVSSGMGTALGGDEETVQGFGEVFVPLRATEDSVLFLYPRVSGFEGDEQYYSLGSGARWIVDQELVFGLNVFYDHAEVDDLASFDRFGFGLEFLTEFLDVRLNGYLASNEQFYPEGPLRILDYGDLYAREHGIYQPLTVVGMEAYDGVEIEAGRRFSLPDDFPFWVEVYAGIYNYSPPSEAEDLSGFRVRTEIGLTEHLSLEAAYYDDEELVGGHTYVGVRASIPLGRTAPASSSRSGARTLASRLTDRVYREHRVLHSDTVVKTETVAKDVLFVNKGGAVGNGIEAGSVEGEGTAESPLKSIQEAADLAAKNNQKSGRVWTIYTQGGTHFTYREDVEITESTRFVSSALPIWGLGGKWFGNGEFPEVNGGFQGGSLDLVEISGYSIYGGARSALADSPNTLLGRGAGDGIFLNRVGEVVLTENRIDGTKGNGISLATSRGTPLRAMVVENNITDSRENGIAISATSGSSVEAHIANNESTNNGENGLLIDLDHADFRGEIVANTLSENDTNGFALHYPNSRVEVLIEGNVASDNGENGFQFRNANGILEGTIANNVAENNAADGFHFGLANGQLLATDIIGNTARSNGRSGFWIEVPQGAGFRGEFANNTANNNGVFGFHISNQGSSWRGDFSGNTANGNQAGTFIVVSGGTWTGDFIGNQFSNNTFGGGLAITSTGGMFTANFEDNIADNNRFRGMGLFFDRLNIHEFNGNRANDNGRSGIWLQINPEQPTIIGLNIQNNSTNRNEQSGFFVQFGGSRTGVVHGSFSDNTANRNGSNGFGFYIGGSLSDVMIDRNFTSYNGRNGFHIDVGSLRGSFSGTYRDNVSNFNEFYGVSSRIREVSFIDSGNIQTGNGTGPRDSRFGIDELGNNISGD